MRKLRYGMVGGGPGAFIGDAHRRAIRLGGRAELVAGCFSRDPQKSRETAEELGVAPERHYASAAEMAAKEAERPDGIDFVVIVTPNCAHFDACNAFMEAGVAISCDKPVTTTLAEAKKLEAIAKEKSLQFMVTYTYSGHVTAMHIREMIRAGGIGKIRTVMGEYPQGWLADENVSGNKQAEWRLNPDISGKTNALGDIGTHIENTVSRMTGLKITKVLARMDRVVPGRRLDDNSFVLVEYEGGATGMYWASQIAVGHDNGLSVRIYGEKGSILWSQEASEKIKIFKADGALTELCRGQSGISEKAARYQLLPSGHAEGFLEAMGNLYENFISCLAAQKEGVFTPSMIEYPTIEDGVNGLAFVEACLKSVENGNVWVSL